VGRRLDRCSVPLRAGRRDGWDVEVEPVAVQGRGCASQFRRNLALRTSGSRDHRETDWAGKHVGTQVRLSRRAERSEAMTCPICLDWYRARARAWKADKRPTGFDQLLATTPDATTPASGDDEPGVFIRGTHRYVSQGGSSMHECAYGCGSSMWNCGASGPDGIDPHGHCPNSVGQPASGEPT